MEWKVVFHKRSSKKHQYTEDEKKKLETMKKYIGSIPFPSNFNPFEKNLSPIKKSKISSRR